MSDLDKKVMEAMHRLEDLYHETEGKCYISFSGGKDSTVLLALSKMCADIYTLPKDGIKAVFSNTGIEMGITVDFVKWCKENWYPNIEIIRPKVSFDWILKNKGKPTLSKMRSELLNRFHSGRATESVMQNLIVGISKTGKRAKKTVLADKDMHFAHPDFPIMSSSMCCTYLKKKPFAQYAVDADMHGNAIGLRIDEEGARAISIQKRLKNGGKLCTDVQKDGFIKKFPIIDWTDDDVNEFVEKYNVPLSKAYTEFGFHRTGCMACPFARDVDNSLKYLHDHEQNRYKAIMHWLKDVYIAQNVVLPFDSDYEKEREQMWRDVYEPMRQEMLRKYRPNSRRIMDEQQLTLF